MTPVELPFETACNAATASISTLAAMLHFRRTGERWKPRLVVVNSDAAHRRSHPRPVLRLIHASEPQSRA